MRYTFRVDVKKFHEAVRHCLSTSCSDCYIEGLWKAIGEDDSGHCTKMRIAVYEAYSNALTELPEKDEYVILKLKSGKTVHAKLLYDEEEKPGMYYDDFDNWYSLQDVDAVFQSPLNKHTIIAVEYP